MWENIHKSAFLGDKTAIAIMGAGPEKIAQRFSSRIKPVNGGCWQFSGHKNHDGYSKICFRFGSKRRISAYAHRVVFLLHGIELIHELELDHKCRNRWCVNPAHITQVSHKENVLRGLAPSSVNKKKTHCKNGHEFADGNTYIGSNNGRGCRLCRKIYVREYMRIYRRRG